MKFSVLLITSLLLLSAAAEDVVPPTPAANPLLGVWQNETDTTIYLRFLPEKCLWLQNGVTQFCIARYEEGKVSLAIFGKKRTTWGVKVKDNVLSLNAGRVPSLWKRLDTVPAELDPKPVTPGEAGAVPADRVKKVGEELTRRLKIQEAAIKDPQLAAQRETAIAESTDFLRKTVKELGWIDAGRFGAETAATAFSVLQQCNDPMLMLGVLPELQKQAKAKQLDAQMFVRFYDRVKLSLGERQRYGTQLGKNEKGEVLVLPLEDRNKVDEFRAEVGLTGLPKDQNVKFEDDEVSEK